MACYNADALGYFRELGAIKKKWLKITWLQARSIDIQNRLFCFKCHFMHWHTSSNPVSPDSMVTCWLCTTHWQLKSSIRKMIKRNWFCCNFTSAAIRIEDVFPVFWNVRLQCLSQALSMWSNTDWGNMEKTGKVYLGLNYLASNRRGQREKLESHSKQAVVAQTVIRHCVSILQNNNNLMRYNKTQKDCINVGQNKGTRQATFLQLQIIY